MGPPSAGSVVITPFPFSDLTESRLRPAVVIADIGLNDWILCQVTSNPYGDNATIRITDADFESGSLHRVSYVRPGKLFTGNQVIMRGTAGQLNAAKYNEILEAIIVIISDNLQTMGNSR